MIGDWIYDHLGAVTAAMIVLLVIFVFWWGWASSNEEESKRQQCISDGHTWTEIGTHIRTTYIKSGNVLIPLENTVHDYGCVQR